MSHSFTRKSKQDGHETSNSRTSNGINQVALLTVVSLALISSQVNLARSEGDANTLQHQKNLAEALGQLQWLQEPENVANINQTEPTANATVNEPFGLAESTAAGAAAGLMVHDLMTQANGLDLAPFGPPGDRHSDQEADGDSDGRQVEPLGLPGSSLNDETSVEADEQELRAPPEGQQVRFVDERGHLMRQPSLDSLVQLGHQPDSSQTEEPPGEEQSPDSFEGLMRSEGESLDETQPTDGPADQAAGSKLISRTGDVFQLQNARGDEEDGAGDEEEPTNSQLELGESRPSVMMSAQEVEALPMSPLTGREGHVFSLPGAQSNLLDSPIDLNMAAGHYYGKKKKKKVIIVKKKKKKKKMKKKKKKKVYKKVKIIKVKKVKKKPKKYHYPMKKEHHDHGKYYMYAKVPKKKAWEFGFKKGNKKHWIERHEKGHKNKFKTKVKWYDKKSKGKGLHIWDYNHHDKKKKKKHHH